MYFIPMYLLFHYWILEQYHITIIWIKNIQFFIHKYIDNFKKKLYNRYIVNRGIIDEYHKRQQQH